MKKIFLCFAVLLTAMMVNAGTVVFDFTTAESITAMGLDLPESGVGTNLENKVIRVGDIAITSTISSTKTMPTDNRLWLRTVNGVSSYELRLYSGNTLTLTAATGVSILGIEIQATSTSSLHIDGWSTNTQLYDSVTTVTLMATGTNYISQITVITDAGSTMPENNPDTIPYDRAISVTNALEVGSLLTPGESTSLVYKITGYVSNVESSAEDYTRWGDQTFWIADDNVSTANSNAQGALHVYQGVSPVAVKEGDRISVISAIRRYSTTGVIETINKAPVTIIEAGQEIPQDTIPVIIPDTTPVINPDTIPAVNTDTIPTTAVLANYYDLSNNVVLCCYFDQAPCRDVVLAGSYKVDTTQAWITAPNQLVHFEPLSGYSGWYVAAVPYSAGLGGKPVHLKSDGSFTWDYQVGDQYAWIHKGGNTATIVAGYYGECNVSYPSAGAYIYEIAYWKNHVDPCEDVVSHKYTVYFFPPQCEYVVPAIVGEFDNWQGVAMTQTTYNGAVAYKYTIEEEEGHGFKFFDLNLKWNNEIQYYDYSADIWDVKGQNFILPKATKDTSLIYDFSNGSLYRWTRCNPTYTIVLFDPYCEANPEFTPQIEGEFSNGEFLAMERGTYQGREAWVLTVNAAPGSGYQISEKHFSYGNQIQYYDAVSGLWWGFQTRLFPQEGEGDTIVWDYSDTGLYRYPLCGATDYDSTTVYDIHVTLKAPVGAPAQVEIVGDFSEKKWENGVVMKYNKGYYTATVQATANHQFKFREAHNPGTFLEYADGSAMENMVFGEYMDNYHRVYLDLSDASRYKWTVWSEYVPAEAFNITVQADNSQNGSVSGGGEYLENETAVIMATPRKDCVFERWDDGSTLNPRSVLVTADAVYTAIFTRNVPLPTVVEENTMYFTASDTLLTARRVYSPSEINAYDKLIIATVDNKNVMGGQSDTTVYTYRYNIEYVHGMSISEVSVVEAIPYGGSYRLKVEEGYLAPRCTNCTAKPNQLYAEETGGADWQFVQYGNSVVPQAVAYANRMILYNELAPRFSSYRQVTGLDRLQTTVFKLEAKRIIPQEPEVLEEDVAASWVEEDPLEDIPVEITPQDTTAVISTPYVDFVFSFTVIIWLDEAHTQVFAVLTFDMNGQLLSASFPNNIRRRAPRNNNNISFEIGNLLPNTTYYYSIMACEDDGSILKTTHDSFSTSSAQALESVSSDSQRMNSKLLRDGHLFILRGDKVYTVTGQEVK